MTCKETEDNIGRQRSLYEVLPPGALSGRNRRLGMRGLKLGSLSLNSLNRTTNLRLVVDQSLNSGISFIFLGMIYREISFEEIGYLSTTIAVAYILATSLRTIFITSLYAANFKSALTVSQHLREILNLMNLLIFGLIAIYLLILPISVLSRVRMLEYVLFFGGIIISDITKHFIMFREENRVSINVNFIFVLIGLLLLLSDGLSQDKNFLVWILILYFWVYASINLIYCRMKHGASIRRKQILSVDENRHSRIMLGLENLISSTIYLLSLVLFALLAPNYLGIINLANFYFAAIPLAFFTSIIPIILRKQKNEPFSKVNITLGLSVIPAVFILTNFVVVIGLKFSSFMPIQQFESISAIQPAVILISAATVLNWYFFVPSFRLQSTINYRVYKYTFSVIAYIGAFVSFYYFGPLGLNLIAIVVFAGSFLYSASLWSRANS